MKKEKEASNEVACESDATIIQNIAKVDSKTAKKILENREAVQRLIENGNNILSREGDQ